MSYCETAKEHYADLKEARDDVFIGVAMLVTEMVSEVHRSLGLDAGQKLAVLEFASHLKKELAKAKNEEV